MPTAPKSKAGATYTCHFSEGSEPCTRDEYLANQKLWKKDKSQLNKIKHDPNIARDANGWAKGGPKQPSLPKNPNPTQCSTYKKELKAWSDYQNQHRPVGSVTALPMSSQLQLLGLSCGMDYED